MPNIFIDNQDLFPCCDVQKLSGIPYSSIVNLKRKGIIIPTKYKRYTINQIIWIIVFYDMGFAYAKNSRKIHKKLVGLDFPLNSYDIKNHDVLLLSENTEPTFLNLSNEDKKIIDLKTSKTGLSDYTPLWFKTEDFYHILIYKIKDDIITRFKNNCLKHNPDLNRVLAG